jgi:hypothetical protein
MKPKTTIILAAVAALLVLLTLLSTRTHRKHETLESGPIFPDLKAETLAKVVLTGDAKTVELVKQGDKWLVATEGNYPADTQAMDRLIEKLPLFDRKNLRSRNPEMQKTFEVDDSSGVEVTLADAAGQEVARFRMGKNGPDFRSQYIRPAGHNEVYLVPDYLKSIFDPARPTWRDKTILSFSTDKVKQLEIHATGAPPIVIVKDDQGNYTMTAPDASPAKKSMVESTLRTLSTLRCDAFPDATVTAAEAGLENPEQKVIVQLEDGASLELQIGNAVDAARHYVKRAGDDTIFLLSKGRVTGLLRKAEELKETPADSAAKAAAPPVPAQLPAQLPAPVPAAGGSH